MAHATCIAHAWHAHGRCMVDVCGTSLLDSARGRGQGGVRTTGGRGVALGTGRAAAFSPSLPHTLPLSRT
eukprot:scaffold21611_cov33-Phaeocystis_antarctica.AAC.2